MRKICLITTSRADYGIQSHLAKLLQNDRQIDFSLIVTGMHVSRKYGNTYKEIKNSGLKISKMFDVGMDKYSDSYPEKIIAKTIIKTSEVLKEISPDIVILLGDRYEMFAVAIACTLNNIPIAHIHGGETTQGAVDEVFRHSITKAAYWHFTSCEAYRRRVIQLGEDPARVFNVGSLGVENVKRMKLLSKNELKRDLNISFSKKNLLVTYHPVTLERGQAKTQITELLSALEELKDTTIIITKPNADSENGVIVKEIENFAARRSLTYVYTSLGALKYLSLVNLVDAVVGNSSSGIIEAPSFKTATINIGTRQSGRIKSQSIIDVAPQKEEILNAILQIYTDKFRKKLEQAKNPYEKANTAQNIVDILKSVDLKASLEKQFYDLR